MQITTIGLDLATHWFQVHGVDATGHIVVRRRLWRSGVIAYFRSLEPCLVGMEACATAHHWARELTALGYRVKLMPPAYVKAYVKRNKNDAADAEAICEAVSRPSMRFVPVKDAEQQSVLLLHRARSLLVRHARCWSMPCALTWPNSASLRRRVAACRDLDQDNCSSTTAASGTRARDPADDCRPAEWHDGQNPGDRGAAGQVAPGKPGQSFAGDRAGCRHHGCQRDCRDVGRSSLFRSGREFAAWLGMTPRQNSSGGKERLGRTSKRGDKYIRSLLAAGAVAVLRHARNRPTRDGAWVRALPARKPTKLAAVALANKTARIVWAVMMRGEGYQAKEVFEQLE